MPKSNSEKFRDLHSENQALVLINIWDPASAAIIQKSGSPALATSSASLAWANGYSDGCALPKEVLLNSISQILRVCKVPLTVDIENGYSDSPNEVAKLASDLTELGVAGINVEDGCDAPELFAEKISAIRNLVDVKQLFINARTDVYLQELVEPEKRLNETIVRLEKYVEAGADGVFVPGMNDTADISAVSSSIEAPLNIMISSDSQNVKDLTESGATRISLGPSTFISAYSVLPKISRRLFDGINENVLTYDSMNALF